MTIVVRDFEAENQQVVALQRQREEDTTLVLEAYDHAKQNERTILVERLAKYLRRNDGSSHRPRTAAYYVKAHNILWPKGSEDV